MQTELFVAASVLQNEAGATVLDQAPSNQRCRKRQKSPKHGFKTLETCFLTASVQVELLRGCSNVANEAGAIVFDTASSSHCGRKRQKSPEHGFQTLETYFSTNFVQSSDVRDPSSPKCQSYWVVAARVGHQSCIYLKDPTSVYSWLATSLPQCTP